MSNLFTSIRVILLLIGGFMLGYSIVIFWYLSLFALFLIIILTIKAGYYERTN